MCSVHLLANNATTGRGGLLTETMSKGSRESIAGKKDEINIAYK